MVIWDEAPMQHKHIMKTVKCTFRDLHNSDKPFSGLTIVFGGDFVMVLALYCASLPMFTLTMSYLLRSQSASLSGM